MRKVAYFIITYIKNCEKNTPCCCVKRYSILVLFLPLLVGSHTSQSKLPAADLYHYNCYSEMRQFPDADVFQFEFSHSRCQAISQIKASQHAARKCGLETRLLAHVGVTNQPRLGARRRHKCIIKNYSSCGKTRSRSNFMLIMESHCRRQDSFVLLLTVT